MVEKALPSSRSIPSLWPLFALLSALALTVSLAIPAQAASVACAKLLWLKRISPQQGDAVLRLPYREERHSALLAEPQRSFGTLEFNPRSGEMTKQVDGPGVATLSVKGRQLTMRRGKKVRRVKLAQDSELLWTLNALAALASGSFESLRGNYVTTCTRNNDQWALNLTPAQLKSGSALRTLEVQGLAASLQSVSTVMNNGDTTTLIFNSP